jgi:hypothetical protein
LYILKELPYIANKLNTLKYKTKKIKMTVFAPKEFGEIIHRDKNMINLYESFDIIKNLENIKKAS